MEANAQSDSWFVRGARGLATLPESSSSPRGSVCTTRCPTMGGAERSEVNCVRRGSSSAATGASDSAST
eukprot:3973109-Pleurochrysis_carterae.AAC.1